MEPIRTIPLSEMYTAVWGKQGENNAVQLSFDLTGWENAWPDGGPAVAFRRADGKEYAHTFARNGDTLLIPILDYDTEIAGSCAVVISWIDNGNEARSVIINGRINASIVSLGETPTEPEKGLIEQLNAAAASASASQTAAQEAQTAAQTAQAAAESARNVARLYKESAQEYSRTALNAKIDAENAKQSAETAATSAENYATNTQNYANDAKNYAETAKNAEENATNSVAAADASADEAQRHATAAQEALANMEERYYVPSVDTDGNLSFTPTSSEMTAVDTVNIRGPQGIQGPVGPTGPQGPVGGTGADGVSPIISIEDIAGGHRLTITDKDGTKTVDVLNGTQSDWMENDETSPAYVKGRTHWVEKETAVFFPETSFTSDALTDKGWPVTSPVSNKPAAGTECTVTWNGTEYKCPVQELDSDGVMVTIIGNGEVVGLTGNGEPFMVMLVPDDMAAAMDAYGAILPLDGSTSATITMAEESEVVHPLDPKYIGDLRGQKQITITIAEDGTVTSDTPFATAWAMDAGALQASIIINVSSEYKGDCYASPADVCKVVNQFGVDGYNAIVMRVNNINIDTSDSSDADYVKVLTWRSSGEIGFSDYVQHGLPYIPINQYPNHYLRNTGSKWFPASPDEVKTDLGLSALNTANAGKGLKVADDGTMEAEKYQQPEWGYETFEGAIAKEQTLISADGAFISMTAVSAYPEAGKDYTVIWNGTEYTCPAKEMNFDGVLCVGFGNDTALGGAGTDDPFLIGVFPADVIEGLGGITMYVFALDGSEEVVLQINGSYEVVYQIDGKYIEGAKNSFILNGSNYGSLRSINAAADTDDYTLGTRAIALGVDAKANGEDAVALASSNASGLMAFAVNGATASGSRAFAACGNSTASGLDAVALGGSCVSSGSYSFTAGIMSTASKRSSIAIGDNLLASSAYQHVVGKYNVEDTTGKYLYIVGNGLPTARSNAHTIDTSGNGWFAGTVEATALILTSPNGTRYKVTVSDTGELSTAAL